LPNFHIVRTIYEKQQYTLSYFNFEAVGNLAQITRYDQVWSLAEGLEQRKPSAVDDIFTHQPYNVNKFLLFLIFGKKSSIISDDK